MSKRRTRKLCAALACGAITLGWLEGFQMVSWSNILVQFLITLFSAVITTFLGGGLPTA
jgi:hypothetical protein